ncbi:MAG: DNA translocase FtsK [Coleofasciculus sp. C1-SOL-03]|uniref:DNA translocase FtsK n=1 Tax=Coleofasciculus sp. C1-SOL-03 TaxID=3069522 RepID=UPI0032F869FD
MTNSLTATDIRVAVECPRLFYLSKKLGGKSLFLPPESSQGIGTTFHKLANQLVKLACQNGKFKQLFEADPEHLKKEAIATQMEQLLYQLAFYPYFQEITQADPGKAQPLFQVWQGLRGLIQRWAELLIKNRHYHSAAEVIGKTFIDPDPKLIQHQFTLPDGTKQVVKGQFDNLIFDSDRQRLCVVEYKTYEPVDPSAQLAQVAVYSYLLWEKTKLPVDSAIYCVLPEFKEYYYSWEQLETTVHQLIPPKLQQMQEWLTWEPGQPDPPPSTSQPHLCQICPQHEKCQTLFEGDESNHYLTKPADMRVMIQQLTSAKTLWLDTEVADWNTANPRLSLIQVLANPTDRTGKQAYIFDVLDQPDVVQDFVEQIMANPGIEKVFHNASFDLRFLGKEQAENVTCTQKMVNRLTRKRRSNRLQVSNKKLKTLAVELCQFSNVDSEEQQSDWGQRPLTEKQIKYAKMDTVYLAHVHRYLLEFIAAAPSQTPQTIPSQPTPETGETSPPNNHQDTPRQPEPETTPDADAIAQQLVETLQSFKIDVTCVGTAVGPAFIRVKLKPSLGVKISALLKLSADLQVQLGITNPPLIAPQPGYVSVDLPRPDRQVARLEDYITPQTTPTQALVKIAIGVDLDGKLVEADLSDANTCHFLVGGTTGSGKSEFLRSLLLSLLYRHSPQQLKIALVDPKRVTFPEFEQIPWLYAPIVKDSEDAIALMENLVTEMERRYQRFELAGCSHLDAYNQKHNPLLPRLVCIFDEYADFMTEKDIRNALELSIKRLGSMARAAGIHLIIATQRPEAKVVTPIIRSNLPGRVALRTASEADSEIILGGKQSEAAYLLGKGDLLYQVGAKLQRLQSLFAQRIEL